ncbi:hypothetical protein HDV00_002928 [Rhizophlyctis rosea]|nr:hypothetical protein HDV00_002928 [Rhizophlyctis rosea]
MSVAKSALNRWKAVYDGSALILPAPKYAWIISAGKHDLDRQAIALSSAMNIKYELKHIVPSSSIKWLFPVFQKTLMEQRTQSWSSKLDDLPWYLESPVGHTLKPPLPDIVFSTCQDTTLAALQVKESSGGKAFSVHLHQPFVSVQYHDAVVMQRHEWPTLAMSTSLVREHKIIPTELCLNSCDYWTLGRARLDVPPQFKDRTKPVVAVLLSGLRKRSFPWYAEDTSRLFKYLERILNVHDCTPSVIMDVVENAFPFQLRTAVETWYKKVPAERKAQIHYIEPESISSYDGILKWATHVAVMADSTMMVSEALASERPVYIIGLNNCSGLLSMFHRGLVAAHRTRMFMPGRQPASETADFLSDIGDHPPRNTTYVDETKQVADKVRKLLDEADFERDMREYDPDHYSFKRQNPDMS